jgi:hypothetical protein
VIGLLARRILEILFRRVQFYIEDLFYFYDTLSFLNSRFAPIEKRFNLVKNQSRLASVKNQKQPYAAMAAKVRLNIEVNNDNNSGSDSDKSERNKNRKQLV